MTEFTIEELRELARKGWLEETRLCGLCGKTPHTVEEHLRQMGFEEQK